MRTKITCLYAKLHGFRCAYSGADRMTGEDDPGSNDEIMHEIVKLMDPIVRQWERKVYTHQTVKQMKTLQALIMFSILIS
jgi:hypothetical protein